MSCPGCSEDAKFVGYRTCRPTCLFGKIVYERAYYHCRHCQSGWFPTDAEFGIADHQTSGARTHRVFALNVSRTVRHRRAMPAIRSFRHRLREVISLLGGIAKETVFILDFYHASEHLLEFAKVLHRNGDARQQQTRAWCHTLQHEGGQSLLQELEALDVSRASPQTAEAHRQLLGYVRNNQHRRDYPKYVSPGWPIGSGMVEAACKTVVCQRLKESGMRWREPGTTALSQLRALYKSDPKLWKTYWNRTLCS